MKDKKTKLRTKIFRMTLVILLVTFITLYISNKYGYYEYKKHEQVTLTQDQIKKFEDDVKNGVQVDIEDYLANGNRNYQTKFSQIGLDISNSISKTIKSGVEGFFNTINKLVTESN